MGELRGEQLFSSTFICSYVRFLTFLSPSKQKQRGQGRGISNKILHFHRHKKYLHKACLSCSNTSFS